MAKKVIMPKQGLQMTEGTIMQWLVAEGGTHSGPGRGGWGGRGGGPQGSGETPCPSRGSQSCGSAGPGAALRHPASRPSLAPSVDQ